MTIETVRMLGQTLVGVFRKMTSPEQLDGENVVIYPGMLSEDAKDDFCVVVKGSSILVLMKQSEVPFPLERLDQALMFIRKATRFAIGQTTEEIVFATWPASGHVSGLSPSAQRKLLVEGVEVLRISPDGTEFVEVKDVRAMTVEEVHQVFGEPGEINPPEAKSGRL